MSKLPAIKNQPNLPDFGSEIMMRAKNLIEQESLEQNRLIVKLINSTSSVNPLTKVPEQKKLIVLVDLVDFSEHGTREEVKTIYLLQRYLKMNFISKRFETIGKIHITNCIPTGDGCYIICDECDKEAALNFVYDLIRGFQLIETEDEKPLSMRASALIGTVIPIMDISNHVNFIGEGMNEASRLLSEGQRTLEQQFRSENPDATKDDVQFYSKNSLFIGDSLKQELSDAMKVSCNEIHFSDVGDKHGLTRNITVLQGIR